MVENGAGSEAATRWTDFRRHTTETRPPIWHHYKDHDVSAVPPEGPGITMLVMLNILSRFDLTKLPA